MSLENGVTPPDSALEPHPGEATGDILSARRRRDEVLSLGFFWACLIFTADQFSKWATLHVLDLENGGPRDLTPFLELRLVWNRGISYGFLQQSDSTGRWLLVAFTLLASGLVLNWLHQARTKLLAVSLGLILGGALGNLVDRVAYGAVVDFVHFHFDDFSWYVFNVADAAIVVGVVGLIFDGVRGFLWGRRSRKDVKSSGVSSEPVMPRTDAAESVEHKT